MLPATTATKNGHYQSVCSSKKHSLKKVHEVEEDRDEVLFLGKINSASTDYWTAQIKVNGRNTPFKLGTGAVVTVLSDRVQWLQSTSLRETSHTRRGPGNICLPVKVSSMQRENTDKPALLSLSMSCTINHVHYSADRHVLNWAS